MWEPESLLDATSKALKTLRRDLKRGDLETVDQALVDLARNIDRYLDRVLAQMDQDAEAAAREEMEAVW